MRTRTARPLTIAAATVALAVPLASPATASTTAKGKYNSATTIRVEPLWSATGERIEISGEVFDAKTRRPLTNRPVQIQYKTPGAKTWLNLRRIETGAAGNFSFTRLPSRPLTYRAVYGGNAWYYLSASGWVTQTAKSGIRTQISSRLYNEKGQTRVKGRVYKLGSSPVRPLRGANVTIERARPFSSTYTRIKSLQTDKNGYYSFRSADSAVQCNRYRAIYKGNSTFAPKSTIANWSSCT